MLSLVIPERLRMIGNNLTIKISPLSTAFRRYLNYQYCIEAEHRVAFTIIPDFDWREQRLVSLLDSCSTMREMSQIHSLVIRSGFAQHVFVVGRLISFCAVSDFASMGLASSIFEGISFPDTFLYNTMIRGFSKTGSSEEALSFFRSMLMKGKSADNFTFSFLLKLCGQLSMAELGKQLHCSVLRNGYELHIFVKNTLIHMYAMLGDSAIAIHLFEEMPARDLVSWNVLIDGLVHCAQHRDALRVFARMRERGFAPDSATFVEALSACAELGELSVGQQVHSQISTCVLDDDVSVSNSLIDMYSKCGAIGSAILVFRGMKERNVVSWNSIILGFAMHGQALEALQLFEEMRLTEVVEPNGITFLGVLCACNHGGLVQEGKQYFQSMRRDYGIDPAVQHYGCLVDLLGRSGLLKEAYELIKGIPAGGNAVMWRALLGACRVHGDLEMGESVMKHLMELEPEHSGDFALISQMYATAGRWNDVLEVRGEMLGMGVLKLQPGNSSVHSQAMRQQ